MNAVGVSPSNDEEGGNSDEEEGVKETPDTGNSSSSNERKKKEGTGIEIESDGEDVEQAQASVGRCAPCKPSETEVEIHNRTHLPYRSWCPICVQARAQDLPHRNLKEGGNGYTGC